MTERASQEDSANPQKGQSDGASASGPSSGRASPGEMRAFIEHHVSVVEPLAKEAGLTSWEASINGADEANDKAAAVRAELMRIYANPDEYRQLCEWDESPADDPTLARQIRLLRLAYAHGQQGEETIATLSNLEKDLQSAFVNFRGVIGGKPITDNELTKLLSEEKDSARLKEAWEASKQIGGQVERQILQAVALRNSSARKMGYTDYYSQSLELSEIDQDRLFTLLGELEKLTDEPFRQMKSELDVALARHYGIAVDQLRPWHFGDPFFQRPPKIGSVNLDRLFTGNKLEALAIRTFDGIGLEVRDVIDRSDLYSRAGKDQHAFCTHIDRKGDVRVLCNLESDERWMETLLHELGHAVYDKYIDLDLPFILREPAHILSTEAIAMLFGRFALDASWLETVAGAPAEKIATLQADAAKRQRLSMLIFVRWMLVMANFERDLYARPETDLNALWWDYVERFQLIKRPDGRNAPDWAAKIHLALYPAYYQNYLLGELMASHLNHWLEREAGGLLDNDGAGLLLKGEYFRRGTLDDWDTTLEKATGERLDPKYFVADFVGEDSKR